jgi:hypothetical protein
MLGCHIPDALEYVRAKACPTTAVKAFAIGLFTAVATPPVAPVKAPVGINTIVPLNPGHGNGIKVIANAPLTVVM